MTQVESTSTAFHDFGSLPPHKVQSSKEYNDALALLIPSLADVVLGAGWEDNRDVSEKSRPAAPGLTRPSSSSSSTISPASTPSPSGSQSPDSQFNLSASTDALLVRSCQQGWDRSFELHRDWPRPSIRDQDEIVIRNVAVGLNPVDFKSVLYNFGMTEWPCVLGRDVAGVVDQVGTKVTNLKVGDRVWTCADSRDSRAGAYQRFSVAKSNTVGRIADNVTDHQAATVGTGLVTAAIAMYWFFNISRAKSLGGGKVARASEAADALPEGKESKWIIVYGGGAITGIYAEQLAHLSGLRVLAIASPSNFDYLKSLGVEAFVDRNEAPEAILAAVREKTGGHLAYAMDCVGSKTASLCERALQQADGDWDGEGQLICLAGNPKPAPPSESSGDAPTPQSRKVTTHRISFSTTFYGDAKFSVALLSDLDALFASGDLQPAKAVLLPDGLAGVRKGLESLRDGTGPRAAKYVVDISETPNPDSTILGLRTEAGWNGL